MSLPRRITVLDIQKLTVYFASKPTGATLVDAKRAVDASCFDQKKIDAIKALNFLAEADGRLKVTEQGRSFARGSETARESILRQVIAKFPAYLSLVERAVHRNEDALSAVDVGAYWHEHFSGEASSNDGLINEQVIAFFGLAVGARLGTMVVGRRGAPTRFNFDLVQCAALAGTSTPIEETSLEPTSADGEAKSDREAASTSGAPSPAHAPAKTLGQCIFIAHGKNRKPLEQLRKILDQFKIPYKVAIEEANLGRPISAKVKDTMESCNCAILIFTADEEFLTRDGKSIWRPSENVPYELGASGYLYENRIVVLKEDDVTFPSNFKDLCYISFAKDNLDAKAMDIIKELIGFNILRVSV